ncbi:MAG TPA: hypothetical protein VFP82_01685 [Chthoniobacterales bacterium]|nr:hypothetical protein [Chthoniobacterales bacterium]
MRFDHGFGGGALDFHPTHEVGELDFGRTGHHDNSVAQGFTTGFIKEWNVCKEKFGRSAVLVRFITPLPANPRMENFFERASLGRVLENYGAKCLAIQVAGGGKNARAKSFAELALNFLKIDNLPGTDIGIEKLRFGQEVPETLGKSAFACRNSAGDPDCWHGFALSSD